VSSRLGSSATGRQSDSGLAWTSQIVTPGGDGQPDLTLDVSSAARSSLHSLRKMRASECRQGCRIGRVRVQS
jgi:hypothetical protein